MPVFTEKSLTNIVSLDKGTTTFDGLLLDQYRASPNLNAYAGAFLAEFDLLFEQAERMYLGRFMEYATGDQLNTLGEIVGISRELTIDSTNFGFMYDPLSDTFGTISDNSIGSVFLSINPLVVQLEDSVFRRVVRAKAMCNGAKFQNLEFMYYVISILIGEVPSTFELRHDIDVYYKNQFGFEYTTESSTFGTTGDADIGGVLESINSARSHIAPEINKIILTLEGAKSSVEALSLIKSMKQYFVPSGYMFEFNLI